MKNLRRFLVFVLFAFATVFAFSMNSVKAADSVDYEETAFGEGSILITTVFEGTKYYLPAKTTSSAPIAEPFTSVNSISSDNLWKVTKTGENYYIQNSDNKYLYTTASNNGVRVGATECVWEYNTTKKYLKGTTHNRYLGVYNAQDWRSYTTYDADNYKGSSTFFVFYKIKEVDINASAQEKFSELSTDSSLNVQYSVENAKVSGFVKVTDASTLKAGDTLIFACESKNKFAGAMSEEKYMSSVDEMKSAITITLGGVADAWTFTTTEGIISASSSNLYTNGTGTSTWKIEIASSNNSNAVITSTDTNNGTIQYNASKPRFKTYTTTQTAIQIYRLQEVDGYEYSINELSVRFGTMIEKALYDELMAEGTEVKFGVAVIRTEVLTTNSETLADYEDNEEVYFECTPVRVNEEGVADENGEYYQFALVVEDLEEYYDLEFTAACYVSIDGEITLMNVADDNTATKVAQAYVDADDTSEYSDHLGALRYLAGLQ